MSADYVHPQNHERGLGCSRCKKTRFRKISRTKSRRQADHTVLGPLRRAGCSRFPSVCKAIPLRQKHEMQAFCNAHWAHGARLKSTISQKCCRPNPMHWFSGWQQSADICLFKQKFALARFLNAAFQNGKIACRAAKFTKAELHGFRL